MSNTITNQQTTGSNEAAEQVQNAGPNPTLLRHIESFSRFGPTLRATVHAVCAALLLPLLLGLVVWQLLPNYEASSLRGSVLRSLVMTLPMLFCCLILFKSLKRHGVAESYYGWSPQLCNALASGINWMILFSIPFQFLYTALETFDNGRHYGSLGRLFFIGAMAMFAAGLWIAAGKLGTWMQGDNPANQQKLSSFSVGRKMLLRTAIAAPICLAVMTSLGYQFTSVTLSWRMFWTVLLTIGIAMASALVSRLLLITQFRIKLRQLTRDDDGEIDAEESIDIQGISSQVNQLLRVTALVTMVVVGWSIWAHVIPSFGIFDTHVWHSATQLTETGEKSWVTIQHLLMAVGMLAITMVLSRNLPGLLEITLLDRLPLDRGGRYAISFVVRYLVGVFGILASFQMAGFSWTSLQWLAAGLTVGLGFGLQEIFANLISGIIILIERPIRVGDLVTVNNVTGTVTQMQLRATTIKDLDHRELIVPNKKFITEDVMNWTLSDRLSRLIFEVGVAYGSDTELVQKSLLEVAHSSRRVLNDPAPQVVFKQFGASTLDFELRVMIASRDFLAEVRHELNMKIDRKFRERNIEIAFPQQDLHIKGLESLSMAGVDGTASGAEQGESHPSSDVVLPNDALRSEGRRRRAG